MTCGDNEQSSKTKVQRKNKKTRAKHTRTSKKLKVGQVVEGGGGRTSIQIFHY